MAKLSPKVREKNAAKWEASSQEKDLYPGEVIWAFVNGRRMKPVTQGAAITNARIIGFLTNQMKPEQRVPLDVAADQIRALDFDGKGLHMRVYTDEGEVDFGSLDKSEVEFAKHNADHLWRSGIDSAVTAGIARLQAAAESTAEEEARARAERGRCRRCAGAKKHGPHHRLRTQRQVVDSIARHSHADEIPWFQRLVGTPFGGVDVWLRRRATAPGVGVVPS